MEYYENGGGANAGDINNWNYGVGTPDLSSPGYAQAWDMETTFGISSVITKRNKVLGRVLQRKFVFLG